MIHFPRGSGKDMHPHTALMQRAYRMEPKRSGRKGGEENTVLTECLPTCQDLWVLAHQLYKTLWVGINIPILQMRKWSLRKVNTLVQGNKVSTKQSLGFSFRSFWLLGLLHCSAISHWAEIQRKHHRENKMHGDGIGRGQHQGHCLI